MSNEITHARSFYNPSVRAVCGQSLSSGSLCIVESDTASVDNITCPGCRSEFGYPPLGPVVPEVGSKWQYRLRSGSNKDRYYAIAMGPDTDGRYIAVDSVNGEYVTIRGYQFDRDYEPLVERPTLPTLSQEVWINTTPSLPSDSWHGTPQGADQAAAGSRIGRVRYIRDMSPEGTVYAKGKQILP